MTAHERHPRGENKHTVELERQSQENTHPAICNASSQFPVAKGLFRHVPHLWQIRKCCFVFVFVTEKRTHNTKKNAFTLLRTSVKGQTQRIGRKRGNNEGDQSEDGKKTHLNFFTKYRGKVSKAGSGADDDRGWWWRKENDITEREEKECERKKDHGQRVKSKLRWRDT